MILSPPEWSLTQAARVLDQPTHRLIYLCEQRVVDPELGNASGRGSSRRFSARNLLELAIALRLRDLQIPVPVLQAVVYVLRGFEKWSRSSLPESLLGDHAPDLRIVIRDGRLLYTSLHTTSDAPPEVFGGIDLQRLRGGRRTLEDLEQESTSMKPLEDDPPASHVLRSLGDPERRWRWRVEVSVTRIAQDVDF